MGAVIGILFLSTLISCLIGAAIGSAKGRGVAGFWLGLLGLPGWIIAAVISPTAEVEARRMAVMAGVFNAAGAMTAPETTRSCPFCAEQIKPAATVCRYCGRDVDPLPREEATETAIAALRRRYPKELDVALPYLTALTEQPERPTAWLGELCKRIQAGSPPAAAAARITFEWSSPGPLPTEPVPRLPVAGTLGPPEAAGDFPAVAADYPKEYDLARSHMAGLAERPRNPEAWLRVLCRRMEAGSPPAAAASQIPLDWTSPSSQ
jgi:hypothetical protein